MKKILVLSSALALSAIMYMSCQKQISIPNAEEVSASSKRGPINEVSSSEPVFTLTSSTGDMSCVDEEVTITFGAAATCGSVRLEIWNITTSSWEPADGTAGTWQNPATGDKTYTFTANADRIGTCPTAGYKFRVHYNTGNASGNGCNGGSSPYSAGFSAELCVAVEQCNVCQYDGNEFSGTAVSCGTSREAVYTFGSEEGVGYFKMQGGLTASTTNDASVEINGSAVIFTGTETQGSQTWDVGTINGFKVSRRYDGNSNNQTIKVEGSLIECSGVEVRILWSSSNSNSTITGSWSVKDADGVELATSVTGLTCGG